MKFFIEKGVLDLKNTQKFKTRRFCGIFKYSFKYTIKKNRNTNKTPQYIEKGMAFKSSYMNENGQKKALKMRLRREKNEKISMNKKLNYHI